MNRVLTFLIKFSKNYLEISMVENPSTIEEAPGGTLLQQLQVPVDDEDREYLDTEVDEHKPLIAMRSSRSIAALATAKTDFSSVKPPPIGIAKQP